MLLGFCVTTILNFSNDDDSFDGQAHLWPQKIGILVQVILICTDQLNISPIKPKYRKKITVKFRSYVDLYVDSPFHSTGNCFKILEKFYVDNMDCQHIHNKYVLATEFYCNFFAISLLNLSTHYVGLIKNNLYLLPGSCIVKKCRHT